MLLVPRLKTQLWKIGFSNIAGRLVAVHFSVGLELVIVSLFQISWRAEEQEEREREGAGTGGGGGASVNCWTLCFPCNLLQIAKDRYCFLLFI